MNRSIFRLAIPNIISNITVPLLGLVDMFIVGHLDSPDYIGAIALSTMVFNVIYLSFNFLRMGTGGFAAQSYGAKNWQECTNILLRSLFVALTVGFVIICLQQLIAYVGFTLIDRPAGLRGYALEYFNIYIWSAPAVLGMYALNGWYIGMQNAKTPMYIAIGINVVNIGLSFLFVYVLHMNIKGVALASLCAQYSGFIASLIICNVHYKNLNKYTDLSVLKDKKSYIPFFKVNSNIFIRTLALVSVTTFFTSTSASYGADILAINALLMQLFILFSYMMDGFAYAAEALTGKLVGAGDRLQLRKLIKHLFAWGLLVAGIFTLAYALFSSEIMALLTDKKEILTLSEKYIHWALLFPIAGFSAFLWDGIFIGATASRQMRNSMLIAVVCFFSIYYIFNDYWLNNTLWIAFISYLIIRGVVQTAMAPRILRNI